MAIDKKEIISYLETKSDMLYGLSDTIWDNPETLFEEFVSAEALCKALEAEGFAVQRGVAGMETAFVGRFGKSGPVIGFLAEYDALSNLSQVAELAEKQPIAAGGNGHGCGHHMLGVGALAGALGLKKYLEETGKEGTVVFFGCPAEEGGSGKTYMAREGCFDEVDCALTWHPGDANAVASGSTLANYQAAYRFKGVSSHAAAAPEKGRSALDAVELMNSGVQYLREHIIQEARIHYAITDTGGFSPNVVQANAEVLYLMRAPQTPDVADIYERVNMIAKGAAMMSGTEVEIDFIKGCSNIVSNFVLEKVLAENMREVPLPSYTEAEMALFGKLFDTLDSPEAKIKQRVAAMTDDVASPEEKAAIMAKAGEPVQNFIMPYKPSSAIMPASTDVGDVSWNCPTAQITTATWISGTPAHSWQAVSCGKSACAHKATLYAGQVLALTAIDLVNRPETVAAAQEELKNRLGGTPYICPIPPEVKPRKITK